MTAETYFPLRGWWKYLFQFSLSSQEDSGFTSPVRSTFTLGRCKTPWHHYIIRVATQSWSGVKDPELRTSIASIWEPDLLTYPNSFQVRSLKRRHEDYEAPRYTVTRHGGVENSARWRCAPGREFPFALNHKPQGHEVQCIVVYRNVQRVHSPGSAFTLILLYDMCSNGEHDSLMGFYALSLQEPLSCKRKCNASNIEVTPAVQAMVRGNGSILKVMFVANLCRFFPP